MNTPDEGHKFLEKHVQGPLFESKEDLFDRGKIEAAVRQAVEVAEANMGQIWPQLSEFYHEIIGKITREEMGEELIPIKTLYRVAAEYLVQERIFFELREHYGLTGAQSFNTRSTDGVMALTLNNSLIIAAPVEERNRRNIEYIRIPARGESWTGQMSYPNSVLSDQVAVGHRVKVDGGVNTSKARALSVIPWGKRQEVARMCEQASTALHSTMGYCQEEEAEGE